MKQHMVLLLLLYSSVIFGAQQLQKSDFRLHQGASHFNILSTDLNCLLAAKLPPQDKNTLRATCKTFSTFLSFCNASKFVLYPGFFAAKKDICRIFAIATFNNNIKLVKELSQKYDSTYHNYDCIERKCRFLEINSRNFMCLNRKNELTIDTYSIAQNNNYTKMMDLLKEHNFNHNTSPRNILTDSSHLKAFNLLIACISRNTQHIIQAMQDIEDIKLGDIGYSLAVIIDNDDAQSLATIMQEKKIQLYIKKNGFDLLNLAIFGKHQKVAEILINSKHFDFNAKRYMLNEKNSAFEGTYIDFLNCCTEHSNIDQSIFDLLTKNGAKTSADQAIDLQTIISYIKIAWNDFTWNWSLNKQ
jgi:hypothetical protein